MNAAERRRGHIALEANSKGGWHAGWFVVMHWVERRVCSKGRWSTELEEGGEEKNTEQSQAEG